LAVDEVSVDELVVDEVSVYEVSVDKLSVYDLPWYHGIVLALPDSR
jgi:hypothetical protein